MSVKGLGSPAGKEPTFSIRFRAKRRFHFESQVADKMRSGISESEARRLTRLEFCGIDQIKEEGRVHLQSETESWKRLCLTSATEVRPLGLRLGAKGSQFIGSLPTSEPPETARGYSSFKRTASASQPVKGLNCIQESFSRSDLLRCSFVANLPFR
jgi:hypothetical protein